MLTEEGIREAEALGRRLAGREFDIVVASDLSRATSTAESAGFPAEPDPAWREIDIGSWEGLSREQVAQRHPDQMAALVRGDEIRLGGGETWQGFCSRVDEAFSALVSRLDDGGRALVVSHGGVVHAVASDLLGFRDRGRPWPMEHVRNTGITVVRLNGDLRRISVLNDATHVATAPPAAEGDTVVALVRHGESQANVEQRWQGIADGPLTDRGLRQGADLADWYGPVDHVYTSHLQRARLTAEAFAAQHGLGLTVRHDLHEIAFGTWENLTMEEIAARDPQGWAAFRDEGKDVPRGHSGETFAAAVQRLASAVADIAAAHVGERVAVVSHGGVIRGFVGRVVGLDHRTRLRFDNPGNTSVANLRVYPERPVLVDYNLGVA